jgi:tRNA threonylcarbamoyl adenosine modification protein (Sua5/YciO/YrdC/YwlC family)
MQFVAIIGVIRVRNKHLKPKKKFDMQQTIWTVRKYCLNVAMQFQPKIINVSDLLGSGSFTKQLIVPDDNRVAEAAHHLRAGNVIALPTDTVYGLACSANNPIAIQKLYDIKGRDENKPVAICVANLLELRKWGEASHLTNSLLTQLLPGAVTIVLYKSSKLDNPYLNPGVRKIAIRIPDQSFIQKVSTAFNYPIALTSANRSSEKSTLEVSEFKDLWSQLGAIFDGGHLGEHTDEQLQRSASTIVDLSEPGFYAINRQGCALQQTINVMKEFDIRPL